MPTARHHPLRANRLVSWHRTRQYLPRTNIEREADSSSVDREIVVFRAVISKDVMSTHAHPLSNFLVPSQIFSVSTFSSVGVSATTVRNNLQQDNQLACLHRTASGAHSICEKYSSTAHRMMSPQPTSTISRAHAVEQPAAASSSAMSWFSCSATIASKMGISRTGQVLAWSKLASMRTRHTRAVS